MVRLQTLCLFPFPRAADKKLGGCRGKPDRIEGLVTFMREEPRRGRGDDEILARPGRRELSVLAFLTEALVSFFSFPLVSGNKTKSRKGVFGY